jgi:hypothetical protein
MSDDKGGIDKRLIHDKKLEEEAKRLGDYQMHPLLTRIHSKMGLANLLRNDRNKTKVDIENLE